MTEDTLRDLFLAILLLRTDGITEVELEALLAVDHPQWREMLAQLVETGWGPLQLVLQGGQVQARLHPRYLHLLQELQLEKPRPLRKAVLETLAIIAYQQPITRPEIEHWRGVALGSGILQQLQDFDWIEIKGHRDGPGRPALWGTTTEFLRHFGLSSLAELPAANLENAAPES
ncbi:SMC-Scp complex subunit ScpB [Acidithiobacillus sp. AMEEHan]|uniref:SMC-Scp complex subunit ScpB n=1 Tax=Acidithiobacillus sp. AMEEHan TaxID=2994951 RepID=UPI0027E3B4D3|nr:SMC-Scp complex subunit ScpB [Acidithiobacillus sp. AMEEHan]